MLLSEEQIRKLNLVENVEHANPNQCDGVAVEQVDGLPQDDSSIVQGVVNPINDSSIAQGVAVIEVVEGVRIGIGERIEFDDSYDEANLPVDEFEESIPADPNTPRKEILGHRVEAGQNRNRAGSIAQPEGKPS